MILTDLMKPVTVSYTHLDVYKRQIQGWVAYKSPKRYKKYGSQKGWERVNQAPPEGDGFQEITEEEARQMELPF